MLQAGGVTDRGLVRTTNEDCFVVDEGLHLCVVADGMGGHQAGEVAAQVAVEAVLDTIRGRDTLGWPFGFDPSLSETGNLIRTAIHLANTQVLEVAGSRRDYAGMGTTIVAAMVVGGRLSVGHVGDSRLYRLGCGRFRQLTADDSWLASMLATDPHADVAILKQHPMRHALTNVVGARPGTDVHVAEEPLEKGDLLLLTTDGVHGVVEEDALERLLRGACDVHGAASDIVRTAMAHGSRDNCTAVVARYSGAPV
jgi:protein phosphatase